MEPIPGPIFWHFYHAKVRSPMKYLVFELLARLRALPRAAVLFFRPPPRMRSRLARAPPLVRFAAHRIGGKIPSGRTKDQNIGQPPAGSGRPTVTSPPTVAKAFAIRPLATLHKWVKTTGADERSAPAPDAHPQGRESIRCQERLGFWIVNVIVMAGVPSIMQAMLDEVGPKRKIGVRMLSEIVRADAREGDIGMQLGEIDSPSLPSFPFCIFVRGRPPTSRSKAARDTKASAAAWAPYGYL
jgi:hypothetical protein